MLITGAGVALLAELFSPLCASTYCRQKKEKLCWLCSRPTAPAQFQRNTKQAVYGGDISIFSGTKFKMRQDKKKKKNCCGHATAFLLSTSPAVTSPFFADYELLTQHQIEGTSPHYSSWWHASTCARSLFGDNRLKHSVIRCVKLHG